MKENKQQIFIYIVFVIIIYLVSFFASREVQDVKNRYKLLQEEKTSLVKEYNKIELDNKNIKKENQTLKQIIEDNEYDIKNSDTRRK